MPSSPPVRGVATGRPVRMVVVKRRCFTCEAKHGFWIPVECSAAEARALDSGTLAPQLADVLLIRALEQTRGLCVTCTLCQHREPFQ